MLSPLHYDSSNLSCWSGPLFVYQDNHNDTACIGVGDNEPCFMLISEYYLYQPFQYGIFNGTVI